MLNTKIFKNKYFLAPLFFTSLQRYLKNSDIRATCILIVTGIAVGYSYWSNATLVYDDIAFPASFSSLVNQIGWFKTLVKIFCLDLPSEYRTYGLSRVIQFLLWSMGADSVHIYSSIISLMQLITAWCLYALLKSLRIETAAALSSGLIWVISPFIWTSCFHHYSYLIFPFQIGIIGTYFLCKKMERNYKTILAIFLGIALGLTGELHLLPISFFLVVVALTSGNRSTLRAALWSITAMGIAVAVHFFIWKMFVANSVQPHRFNLSLSHDTSYWMYRIYVAAKGIGLFWVEQIAEMIGSSIIWFIGATILCSFVIFVSLSWSSARSNIHGQQREICVRSSSSIAIIFFVATILYLGVFVLVVVLADSVPHTLPRRYGYIPLTTMLIALCLAAATITPGRRSKLIVKSFLIGGIAVLFIRQQGVIIPTAMAADRSLSEMISNAIKQAPDKVVVFFSASEKVFPLTSIGTETLGPAMRNVASAELSQAKYGTYWPAFINITKVLGAPYTCELGGIQIDKKLALVCPPWQENPGVIDSSKVIIVANLGFDQYDPLGEHVRVFKNYSDFEPFFFAKTIIRNIEIASISSGEAIAINFGTLERNAAENDIFPDKHLKDPIGKIANRWLQNYGWTSGDDRIYKHPSISINSEYYRSNRNGNFEYYFNILKSDIDIDLDFWEQWALEPGQRLFKVEISWNDGPWVSLGKIDPALINGSKPFSIHLAHQNTHSFALKLSSLPGTKDVPFLQGVRITRRPS